MNTNHIVKSKWLGVYVTLRSLWTLKFILQPITSWCLMEPESIKWLAKCSFNSKSLNASQYVANWIISPHDWNFATIKHLFHFKTEVHLKKAKVLVLNQFWTRYISSWYIGIFLGDFLVWRRIGWKYSSESESGRNPARGTQANGYSERGHRKANFHNL